MSTDLGRRLRGRRQQLGMSVDEVAAAAGVHPAYLLHVEERVCLPTLETLILVANALDTDVPTLLGSDAETPVQIPA